MKKITKLFSVLLCMLLLVCALTGCGSSYKSQDAGVNYASDEGFYEDGYVSKDYETPSEAKNQSSQFVSQEDENQKLVYTGDMTIKSNDIDKSYKNLQDKMAEFGARFESVREYSNTKTMIIRVPRAKFMAFVDSLSTIGEEIVDSSVNVVDMTSKFLDNEHRIDILETEYQEIKGLMDKATNIDEIMRIRDRMSEITYELEVLKGYNNKITYDSDYATLTLTLSKIRTTTSEQPSFGIQLKEAFNDGIYALRLFALGLVRIWWVLLIFVVIIVFIVSRVKHNDKRKAKATVVLNNVEQKNDKVYMSKEVKSINDSNVKNPKETSSKTE